MNLQPAIFPILIPILHLKYIRYKNTMQEDRHYELNEVDSSSFSSSQIGYAHPVQQPQSFSPLNKMKFKVILLLIGVVFGVLVFIEVRKIWWEQMTNNDLHRHDDSTFAFPTVGIPTPGNKYNSTKVTEE